ncbi:MAG: DUF4079 family protein [Desulfatibacillum sp.]|nr:DUF4079 family protein [Desulfatibacillum sp.]
MIYMHPLSQTLMFVLGVYALYLAIPRVRGLHTHQKAAFSRKRHALVGVIALGGLLGGMVGGSVIGGILKLDPYIGEAHEIIGVVMALLMAFGIVTGLIQYYKPKPRNILPALHGLGNLIVLLLFLAQAYTGVQILIRAANAG